MDAQRPSGDLLYPAPSAGWGAVSAPSETAPIKLRIAASQSAHSPQSPQKVRNLADSHHRC